jgi:threonine-phosphate decarboxylase
MKDCLKTSFDHGGNVFAVSRSLGVSPEDILDFSASINPLGPAQGVREALLTVFSRLAHYPDSDCTELREALAESHGVEPANICVANGSTQLIYLLPRLAPGKRALVVAPAFSEYARALARDGWGVEQFVLDATDGFAFPLNRLEMSLRNGYDLLILGNPGNPTGRLYPISVVEAIHRLCRAAGCFLILDEAFMDFCEEGSAKHHAAEREGILVLRSLTKFYALPGVRVGYAIGKTSIIARLALSREPWSVNIFAQAAGLASLADAGYAAATMKLILLEREHLFAGLAAIPGLSPFSSAANYLLVEIVRGPSASELAERLLARLILIRACGNFAGLDDRFFRVAVRKREENDQILAALAAAVPCSSSPVKTVRPDGQRAF